MDLSNEFQKLKLLDNCTGVVGNSVEFECPICLESVGVGKGIVLRSCIHQFCRSCIKSYVQKTTKADVKCPADCEISIFHRDIKGLMTEAEYENFQTLIIQFSENLIKDTVHCKQVDCTGFTILEEHWTHFVCEVCESFNCIGCAAIHSNQTCLEYQLNNQNAYTVEKLVAGGSAILCPVCKAAILKVEGCDLITCVCKTQVCWATKLPRWGPNGKGDTSGGCRCMINGIKCHPNCYNCH